jgi:heme oxygenase
MNVPLAPPRAAAPRPAGRPGAPGGAADLPERLRAATRMLHALAERSGVMPALLAGRLPRPRYVVLLASLHAIYEALEDTLPARRGDPRLAPLLDARLAGLARREALAADLALLHGARWRAELRVADAARDYAARVRALAHRGTPALGAHAYVRYLGDLYGGQLLARRVARSYALPEAVGTAFYRFGAPAELPALRAALRTALATLPLTAAEADAFVAEACWGFEQHVRLFEELAAA